MFLFLDGFLYELLRDGDVVLFEQLDEVFCVDGVFARGMAGGAGAQVLLDWRTVDRAVCEHRYIISNPIYLFIW